GTSLQVTTPREGQRIVLQLTAKERLAVVLLVNGVNTYLMDSGMEPAQYPKWVLDKPRQKYSIEGFYPDLKTVKPFKILPDDEPLTYPLADETKRGLVEVFVFREGDTPDSGESAGVNAKGFHSRAKTYEDAIAQLKKQMRYSPTKKGLIIPDANQQEANVE